MSRNHYEQDDGQVFTGGPPGVTRPVHGHCSRPGRGWRAARGACYFPLYHQLAGIFANAVCRSKTRQSIDKFSGVNYLALD